MSAQSISIKSNFWVNESCAMGNSNLFITLSFPKANGNSLQGVINRRKRRKRHYCYSTRPATNLVIALQP